MANKHILKRTTAGSIARILAHPCFWRQAARTVHAINTYFFGLQKKAAKKKIIIPVVNVEHPLDAKIPFEPRYVRIYMDFSPSWVRALGFLTQNFGKRARTVILEYLEQTEKLYQFVSAVYTKIMSTTNRPRYTKSFLFRMIYAFDPHLMCIPSLHVIVVIFLYIKIKYIMEQFHEYEIYHDEVDAVFAHAVAITDSILFVKQHSVNCIAAGMYAIHRFIPALFTLNEAERFADALLRAPSPVSAADAEEIRAHISALFTRFIRETAAPPPLETSSAPPPESPWESPLIDFLKQMPVLCRG